MASQGEEGGFVHAQIGGGPRDQLFGQVVKRLDHAGQSVARRGGAVERAVVTHGNQAVEAGHPLKSIEVLSRKRG